jgi:YD repeat-containing protein
MLTLLLGLCLLSGCRKRQRVTAEFQIDDAGNLTSMTGPDGKKTSIVYDLRGLPIEVLSPDGVAHFGYDAHGNRIWARDNAGTTEYYYDAFDRLAAVIWNRGIRRLIAYEHDHLGLPSRVSVFDLQSLEGTAIFSEPIGKLAPPSQLDSSFWHERERLVLDLVNRLRASAAMGNFPWLVSDTSYVRNLQGELQEIQSEAGVVRFNRSADGNEVERLLPNGVRSVFEYGAGGRISGLRHTDASGREIASFAYEYGKLGRLQNISGTQYGWPTRTDYAWDDHGRLRSLTVNGREFAYAYDPSTRQLSVTSGGKTVTYTFDGLGRIVRAKGARLGMTPQGTMSIQRDDNESSEIRYSYLSRPLEITTRNATSRFTWDSEGNLISVTRNGKAVHFVSAAGSGMNLPLLESGEGGAPEVKLLLAGSILGRLGQGTAQFYLEGASGDPSYTVDGRGIVPDDPRNQALRRPHRSRSMLVPAAFKGLRAGSRSSSASLLVAQWNPYPEPPATDPAYLEFKEGELQGIKQCLNGIFDTDANLKIMQAAAAGEMGNEWWLRAAGYVGIWGHTWGGDMLEQGHYFFYGDAAKDASRGFWGGLSVAWHGAQTVLDIPLIGVSGTVMRAGPFVQSIGAKLIYRLTASSHLDSMVAEGGVRALNEKILKAVSVRASLGHTMEILDTVSTALVSMVQTKWAFDTVAASSSAKKLLGARALPGFGQQLGGIELSLAAQGDIGPISGAVYDPESGSIVLLSNSSNAAFSGIKAEDFAVAMSLVYSDSPEEAAFSLDPADPKNPRGPWLQKVYYPDGILAGTDFGKAMFAADWLLKQYSFGVVVEQGKPQRVRTSSVPGYQSVAALSLANEHKANQPATMSRFWIVSREMKIRREGSAIIFDEASMGVKTKRQVLNPNSKTGLSDDDSVKDPIHEEFARRFTEHFDELAAESPELERVRELAKAVALAKWMRQNNIPVDLAGINLDRMRLRSVDSEAHRLVPALSTTYEKVMQKAIHEHNQEGILTSTTELYLFGGVELQSHPEYLPDSGVGELQRAVQEKLRQSDEPRFDVDYGGQNLTGIVFPLTHEAQVRRANARVFLRDGNIYHFDAQNRLIEMVDKQGNRARYRDVAKGAAGGVEITGKSGWHAVAQPAKEGTSFQITTARGNEISAFSGPDSDVQTVAVDGEPWFVRCGSSPACVRLNQRNYAETLTFDNAGRVVGVQLDRSGDNPVKVPESAKIEYTADGRPARISSNGIPKTEWQYDATGRLRGVWSADDPGFTVTYDDATARTTVESRTPAGSYLSTDDKKKYVFENGRLVSSESPESGNVVYLYDHQRLVSVKTERSGETKFFYDKSGRPAVISLASGRKIQYKFDDQEKPAKKDIEKDKDSDKSKEKEKDEDKERRRRRPHCHIVFM